MKKTYSERILYLVTILVVADVLACGGILFIIFYLIDKFK